MSCEYNLLSNHNVSSYKIWLIFFSSVKSVQCQKYVVNKSKILKRIHQQNIDVIIDNIKYDMKIFFNNIKCV